MTDEQRKNILAQQPDTRRLLYVLLGIMVLGILVNIVLSFIQSSGGSKILNSYSPAFILEFVSLWGVYKLKRWVLFLLWLEAGLVILMTLLMALALAAVSYGFSGRGIIFVILISLSLLWLIKPLLYHRILKRVKRSPS